MPQNRDFIGNMRQLDVLPTIPRETGILPFFILRVF